MQWGVLRSLSQPFFLLHVHAPKAKPCVLGRCFSAVSLIYSLPPSLSAAAAAAAIAAAWKVIAVLHKVLSRVLGHKRVEWNG